MFFAICGSIEKKQQHLLSVEKNQRATFNVDPHKEFLEMEKLSQHCVLIPLPFLDVSIFIKISQALSVTVTI